MVPVNHWDHSMGEVVNFRRAKKEKARAVKTAEADANRVKHGGN